MSTPHTLFTVTLTTDELGAIRGALEHNARPDQGYGSDADLAAIPSALAALDAAKPARATKPRATPAAVEPFSPNTGNPAVDAFMRRKHNPKYKPRPLPKSPGLPPLRPMKVSEQDAAEAAWKAECKTAARVIADGKPSDAEATLRGLIAIHRNPWRLEATERPDSRTETRIFTSPRHPGVAIHEIRTADPIKGKTFRVVSGGIMSDRIHYAAADAELEAATLA